MIRIGIRELRQNASHYLQKVKGGEVVEITERGTLIALLVSPTPPVASRERLIASGRLLPAKNAFELPTRRQSLHNVDQATLALNELREERLP